MLTNVKIMSVIKHAQILSAHILVLVLLDVDLVAIIALVLVSNILVCPSVYHTL